MEKFVFLICAFLLVGAGCTFGWKIPKNPIVIVQKNKKDLITLIESQIEAINDNVTKISRESSENIIKLKDEATKITNSYSEHFFSGQKEMISEIEKGFNESLDVVLTKCAYMELTFYLDTFSALKKTELCLVDTIKISEDYVKNIKQNSNILLKNLTSHKKNVEDCVNNQKNSILQASKCISETTMLVLKQVAPFHEAIVKQQQLYNISELITKLEKCSSVNGVEKAHKISPNIIEEVKTCIKIQKTNAGVKT